MPARLLPDQVLAIEAATDTVHGALVRRRYGRISVVATATVARQPREAGDDSLLLPAEIAALAGRCEARAGACVVVSERVQSVPMTMAMGKLRRLRPEQIREALRWEAEPYLGYPPAEAMAGYDASRMAQATGREAQVLGTFLPAIAFQQCREDCREAAPGLRLTRVYGLDAAMAVLARQTAGDGDLALLHLHGDACDVMGWRDGQAGALVRLPLGAETLSRHLDDAGQDDLASVFREAVDAHRLSATAPLLLTGQRCADEAIRAWLGRAVGRDLAAWTPPPAAEGCEAGAAAVCIAAALRELGPPAERQPGISDEQPLRLRVKQRVHTLPVLLSALVVVLLLLHYAWLRWEAHGVDDELARLKSQIEQRQQALAANDELRAEQTRLHRELRDLEESRVFLTTTEPADRRQVAALAAALARHVPPGVQVTRLESLPPAAGRRRLRLSGGARTATAVNAYAGAVQGEPWCAGVELPITNPAPIAAAAAAAAGSRNANAAAPPPPLPLRFVFTIELKPAQGD